MENNIVKLSTDILEEYRKLEINLCQVLNGAMTPSSNFKRLINAMKNDKQYQKWSTKLDKCRQVRNKLAYDYCTTPSILELQECLEVLVEFNKLDLSSIILNIC